MILVLLKSRLHDRHSRPDPLEDRRIDGCRDSKDEGTRSGKEDRGNISKRVKRKEEEEEDKSISGNIIIIAIDRTKTSHLICSYLTKI